MDIVAFLLGVILFLTGCSSTVKTKEAIAGPELARLEASQEDFVNLYVEKENYIQGMYEVEEGCVLGAYILGDRSINGDISQFESATQREHGIYSYNMILGEEFPMAWVLECFINGAIPNVVLRPSGVEDPFDIARIEALAVEFSRLNVPMFLTLYPNPDGFGFEESQYKDFYNKARNVFKEKAPKVSFVWSTDINNVQENLSFYPEDSATDWVGINIYVTLDKIEQDFFNGLDYFYYQFQGRKPMMISSLGVSHYSTQGHSYEVKKAAELIKTTYETLAFEYPLIKAVIYNNYSNVENSPSKTRRDDFTVTSEKNVAKGYTQGISLDYFKSQTQEDNFSNCLLKSPYKTCIIGGKLYISTPTFEYFIKKAVEGDKVLINNEEYVKINDRNLYEVTGKGIIYKG